jgi:hypothetical protein
LVQVVPANPYVIRVWRDTVISWLLVARHSATSEFDWKIRLTRLFFQKFCAQMKFWIGWREKFEIASGACNLFSNLLK